MNNMRWTANKPKPSYLEYARLLLAYEKLQVAISKAGPKALNRFKKHIGESK